MQIKISARLLSVVMIAAMSTHGRAQSAATTGPNPQPSPALELTYDYIHTNGPPHGCGCFGINGGGVALTYPLRSTRLDLVGSFEMGHGGGPGVSNLDVTLATYTVGARYYPRWRYTRWHPYGEVQAGGAHASGSLFNSPNPAGADNHSAFAGSVGGGLDLAINRRLSLKLADVQYLATTFANGDNDHQNNLRVSAGVIVHFGRRGK